MMRRERGGRRPTPQPATDTGQPGERADAVVVESLDVSFGSGEDCTTVLSDVTFRLAAGQALALVGESGSGKTTIGLALMGLLPEGAGVRAKRLRVVDHDVLHSDSATLRAMRSSRVGMIFQDPLSALNPSIPIGRQVGEVLWRRGGLRRGQAFDAAIDLLDRVRMPEPRRKGRAYPHQLSGGMRQRAVIAMALANRPRLLIADEPTTALDVTVQAQILALLNEIRRDEEMALLIIGHDLAALSLVADRVATVYAGTIVEEGATRDMFEHPLHPYTAGLVASTPRGGERARRLNAIPGLPPSPTNLPSGCPFHPRCAIAVSRCASHVPAARGFPGDRMARCDVIEVVDG